MPCHITQSSQLNYSFMQSTNKQVTFIFYQVPGTVLCFLYDWSLLQYYGYSSFMDEETKVVGGRVTYSQPHLKLAMEPEFEPKQSHAVNHYTRMVRIWMHREASEKRSLTWGSELQVTSLFAFWSQHLSSSVTSSGWLRTLQQEWRRMGAAEVSVWGYRMLCVVKKVHCHAWDCCLPCWGNSGESRRGGPKTWMGVSASFISISGTFLNCPTPLFSPL